MTRPVPTASEVEAVRGELQRLGYLSHRVERYLLQDALRPQQPLRTVLLLAAKLGVLGGALLALGGALLLLAWNPPLLAAPLDLPLLVLHLLPPSALAFGLAFLLLAGVLALLLRWRPGLRVDTLSLLVGLLGGGAALALALWRGRALLAPLEPLVAVVLALGGAVAAYGLGRLLYQGLLALAIRLTDRAPRERSHLRRYLLPGAVAVALALVALPATVSARRPPPPASGFVPVSRGDRVLLVGIDGVLPAELEFLLRRGELPALSGLLDRGGVLARYDRPDEPPAAFWTTIATGLDTPAHGVAAVDSFRPAGLETSLAVSGPFRWYWAEVERPLGLARHRPLLSNKRTAYAFWELLARGGAPVVAVDWWGTYPAAETPGLVVAHGADQLLAEGAPGAVAPAARTAELRALRDRARTEGDEPAIGVARVALPPKGAARLADRALYPERFYRLAFAAEAGQAGPAAPRSAALYLPAVDIAADGWAAGTVPFAELLSSELEATGRMLGELVAHGDWGTVVVVVDPGRRGGGEGRVLLWRRSGCGAYARAAGRQEALATPAPLASPAAHAEHARPLPEVTAAAIGAALFRAAGLPQSGELPEPPALCAWRMPPSNVPTFGPRASVDEGARGDEYLQNLRSLGYL